MIRELRFKENDGGWVATTPIGRYFIDESDGKFECYSDIQELGSYKSFYKAEKKLNSVHSKNILNCLE